MQRTTLATNTNNIEMKRKKEETKKIKSTAQFYQQWIAKNNI